VGNGGLPGAVGAGWTGQVVRLGGQRRDHSAVIPDTPPADAAQWRAGIEHARLFLERVIKLKPDCAAAKRAQSLLAK